MAYICINTLIEKIFPDKLLLLLDPFLFRPLVVDTGLLYLNYSQFLFIFEEMVIIILVLLILQIFFLLHQLLDYIDIELTTAVVGNEPPLFPVENHQENVLLT